MHPPNQVAASDLIYSLTFCSSLFNTVAHNSRNSLFGDTIWIKFTWSTKLSIWTEQKYPNDDCCWWNTAVLSTNYFFLLSVCPFFVFTNAEKCIWSFVWDCKLHVWMNLLFRCFSTPCVCRCVCACECAYVCGIWHLLVSIGNSRGTARKFIVKIRSHAVNNGTVNNVY